MLTQKNKRSAINRVLSKIKGSYTAGNLTVHIQAQGISFREHDHPGLKEVIAEVRKNISAIAEQVPGSFLNDPDGLREFEEAVSSILRRMFEEKLGPPVQIDFRTAQAQAEIMALCFERMLEKSRSMSPAIRNGLLSRMQASLDGARRMTVNIRRPSSPGVRDGVRLVAEGDMSLLPVDPTWDEVLCLAVMIDGYSLAKEVAGEGIETFHRLKGEEYERTGAWTGTLLELWLVLFYYNRKNHWNSGYGFEEGERGRILACSVYQALRSRLMDPAQTKHCDFITP